MLKINSNGSKWYGQEPGTLDELREALRNHTLDPFFEKNFINRNPYWQDPELNEQNKGCTVIAGNFLTLSHVFHIVTDEEEIIGEFEALINENKLRPEYLAAKAAMDNRP
jgi:hypothetical protein